MKGGDVWQELYRLAYRSLRERGLPHTDAEDLAQETLATAFVHMDAVEPGSLRAWVRAVARNKHIDHVRRNARTILVPEVPESAGENLDPAMIALRSSEAAAARDLLGSVSPADARLLELRYLEDHTVAQMAAASDTSVNTVKVGLFRARKRLRTEVERARLHDEIRFDS